MSHQPSPSMACTLKAPAQGLSRGRGSMPRGVTVLQAILCGPSPDGEGVLPPLFSHRVLGCTPFIALAYFFLWFLPPFTNLRGLWYMTFYCLFQALATVSRWHPFLGLDPWNPIAGQWPLK